MKSIEELARTYDDAYDAIKIQVLNLQRETSAVLFAEFPDREWICGQADELRERLGTEAVEVNVLAGGKQITIVSQPSGSTVSVAIPDDESLCVLTVGLDEPLDLDSIRESSFVKDHSITSKSSWQAWASAPVHVNGFAAGSVCGLDSRPRNWTQDDEVILTEIADKIGEAVNKWSQN